MKSKIIKLNLEGKICPYTITSAIKKVKEMESDLKSGKTILEVSVDHPPVIDNFPEEFKRRGYQTEIKKISSANWHVIIKK